MIRPVPAQYTLVVNINCIICILGIYIPATNFHIYETYIFGQIQFENIVSIQNYNIYEKRVNGP